MGDYHKEVIVATDGSAINNKAILVVDTFN